MFFNIKLEKDKPIFLQVYSEIEDMIISGMLPPHSKLPSSRELADLLKIARTTVLLAYNKLEDSELIYTIKGKGTFVSQRMVKNQYQNKIDWHNSLSNYAIKAEKLDIMKHEQLYEKGMISFKSIAPDERLFDLDEIKRSFLNLISVEGDKILNYGYARGYKPLIEYLMDYMTRKGVNTEGKSVIITNGFTEGFDLILATIMEKGDNIICENPTHNTAIKQMKLNELNMLGIRYTKEGLDIKQLKDTLKKNKAKAIYLIPSYHNPTGMVMSFEKRKEIYSIMEEYDIPIIEDGFNEELQHLGDHLAPMSAINGSDNSVIYIGSLSKILFPGMRIGWIFADEKLIDVLESVKRSRNIHTSFLDQGILYYYMKSGSFERYLRKIRNVYREKFEITKKLVEELIPHEYVLGDGGLYLFVKLKGINARKLLNQCIVRGVIFTPGDIFYTDCFEEDTLRIGYSRVSFKDIEKGIRIIGEEAHKLL